MVKSTEDVASWFEQVVGKSRAIYVASPFITERGLALIRQALANKAKVVVLTSLDPVAVIMKALDAGALARILTDHPESFSVYDVPGLHAKVIIDGNREAIVGSANLTAGGLANNIELGVLVKRNDVKDVVTKFQGWQGNRRPLSAYELSDFQERIDTEYGNLRELLSNEVTGVVAFPDTKDDYVTRIREIMGVVRNKGSIPVTKFDGLLKSGRNTPREDANSLRKRRMFLVRLGLIEVQDGEVRLGPNSTLTRSKPRLARAIRNEFPVVDEFLTFVKAKKKKEKNWTSSRMRIYLKGKGSTSLLKNDQWESVKRWCACLGLIIVEEGGLKNIREFGPTPRRKSARSKLAESKQTE